MNKRQRLFADTPEVRRKVMSRIRSVDTAPEMLVRSALHALGYRFLKNVKGLPGRPDIVFTRRRKAIFVHGCFWHQHEGCKHGHIPQHRQHYWAPKFQRTIERDARALSELSADQWEWVVLWECELKADLPSIVSRLSAFLGSPREARRREDREGPRP